MEICVWRQHLLQEKCKKIFIYIILKNYSLILSTFD